MLQEEKLIARTLLLTAALFIGCGGPSRDTPALNPERAGPATFVGRESCAECHRRQTQSWTASHHDLAMQVADESTVLANFDNTTFTYAGVTTTFSRHDGELQVRTEGADGELDDFRVAYTFGVTPLQQYLVEFPDGRLQALSVCWDTRPAAEGGQRWFHLYPDENVDHRDVLHWTGHLQNWNYMCAECHSTHVERNYRPTEDRYETTYSEIDVSCEACHGPGSNHALWARAAAMGAETGEDPSLGLVVRLKDTDEAGWIFDAESGTARRSRPRESRAEIETCGRCHVRRSPLVDEYRHGTPLADSYRIALLDEPLYHADGQIDDEVYVYGSFLQSKMYREGVTCKDCHDPHSGSTWAEGNAVCARCHLPATFDTPEHHFHPSGGAGSRCVDCHMPAKSYMVVDPRRDHSFRVPRPDLSEKIGTPNACNGCHSDRDASWAAEVVVEWYGPQRSETFHYGEALHAGRHWQTGAENLLLRLAETAEMPGIARATAVALLGRYPGPPTLGVLERATRDGDPLVRRAAAQALEAVEPRARLDLGLPLIIDPVRSVRLQAAHVLAGVPAHLVAADQLSALENALGEYRAVQWTNAERAESHLNLGGLHLQSRDLEAAEQAYRRALRIQPSYVFSYVNLADLYRLQGREEKVEEVLRRALEIDPGHGDVHHALGLALVRQKRLEEAVESLRRASELRPGEPRYAYVHGVALQSAGDAERAIEVLESAHRRHPAHREVLYALATAHRDRGILETAAEYARKLEKLMPWDPSVKDLVGQLERQL